MGIEERSLLPGLMASVSSKKSGHLNGEDSAWALENKTPKQKKRIKEGRHTLVSYQRLDNIVGG